MYRTDNIRAQKARFGKNLNGKRRIVAYIVILLITLLGASLVFVGFSVGWVIISCAIWPALVLIWHHFELRFVAVGPGNSIEDRLEGDVLASLSDKPSPQDIAQAAMTAVSGQFFAMRFGISPTFLVNMSSAEQSDSIDVWKRADEILQIHPQATLSGATLVAALIGTQPQLAGLLPHLQLDEADLVAGAGWYSRLSQLIDEQSRPKRTGGIARDWSFGYTPLLSRFGVNISEQITAGGLLHVRLDSHQSALGYMLDTFGSTARQNVALVGPLGAGKTSIVHAFAELLLRADSKLPSRLQFSQVISLDASALISSVQTRGELEGLVNRLLVEAYKSKNIIICLDDAQLFFEDTPGSIDLSSILLPVLEGGRLRMILAMDEQRWLQIAQRNPALVAVLNRVAIAPANEAETLLVLQDQLIGIEFQRKVTFMYQALKEAYRLSERYLHDQSQPGRAVSLIESAAAFADGSVVTASSVQRAIEQSRGVKVTNVRDDVGERDRLLNLESLIHERMINQSRAVSVVSDAIRRARSGVRNENRPIGTFLFLGPTGVGKTELAKSLAAVYFGGEDHLVRIDMNEYVRPNDVARLIADGATDPHSLTASIMKQPFSVVLLDEIEKAHPQVLTTLLQLLDEGILRDINNREVSFRDAIIIATSNAGADRIRELIDQGQQIENSEAQLVNELIDSQQFRPEFLNRFVEIVVFRPLTEDELVQVVSLIVAGINKTLSHQKIAVLVGDDAKRKLAAIGYDPRLGARPMRRVVQRSVESLIARRMIEGSVNPGDTIEITEDDIKT
ncbi:ATP-dependent Clp protease ATP-binding subunit [Pedobacter sp.]|nr:ATP-dependent Clp protease ATP-binding subunit [Candidatus Saccharibacteria bacterium]